MATLSFKPLGWFKVGPQARKHFEEADLRQLGESLKVKQLQPVLAREDGWLIAGERRLRAATLVGLPELMVIITDEPMTELQLRIFQLSENLHREDLRDSEKWQACAELLFLNQRWTNKDLAAHLKLSESTVTKYLSPSKCIPEAQKALEQGQIGITAAYEISRAPAEQQGELLRLKLSGTSRVVWPNTSGNRNAILHRKCGSSVSRARCRPAWASWSPVRSFRSTTSLRRWERRKRKRRKLVTKVLIPGPGNQ